MKTLFTFLFIIICNCFSFAQDINQFDVDGKRHGIWKKYYNDTHIIRYEGEFNHGKEVGLFKYYTIERKKALLTATKLFRTNDNIAEIKFLASNGKIISEGQMDGKTYIGTWKYYQKNTDALLTLEHYTNDGELNGERFVYYPNGQIAEKQNYSHGKLEGPAIWYSVKNVVLKEMNYVTGELHGPAKFYNPKGELVSEGQYKRDKKDGLWKYYEGNELVNEKDFTYIPKYKKKTP